MKDDVTLSKFEFEDMIIYAQRYAIGRMTFAPRDVCDLINKHITELSRNALVVIKKDIEQHKIDNHLGNPTIDAPEWIKTLENINRVLSGEVEE
jgi:hypothetical protein